MADEANGEIVYLNNAGMALLHPDVKAAGIQAISDQMHHDSDTVSSIRTNFAKLIDADASCIAMMPSTAFAVTLAAKNLERTLEPGKILVLMDQFNSAVYPWQDVCDRSNGKFTLDIVPYPAEGSNWTKSILERLPDCVVACLPPLLWSHGAIVDLVAIGAKCRSLSIPLIVDGTQAVGAMDCSVKDIRPAFLACSSHKWLRGPSGVSLVYIDPSLHDSWDPLDQHARGRDLAGGKDWDASKDEMGPAGYPEKFFQDARKFESGGKPNAILFPMLRTSLEQVAALDRLALQVSLKHLLHPLLEWVRSSDKFSLPAHHAYHLVGIRPNNMTPDEMLKVCRRLQSEKGIYVAVRCGGFRISPYTDNTVMDIEKLTAALDELSS